MLGQLLERNLTEQPFRYRSCQTPGERLQTRNGQGKGVASGEYQIWRRSGSIGNRTVAAVLQAIEWSLIKMRYEKVEIETTGTNHGSITTLEAGALRDRTNITRRDAPHNVMMTGGMRGIGKAQDMRNDMKIDGGDKWCLSRCSLGA